MAKFLEVESELKKAGFSLIAGIDEAGRGPLAGPLVCAAVILEENCELPDLDDSKKVPPAKREILFTQIIKKAVDYSITFISHKTIDEINILESVKLANKLCIENLTIKPEIALLDGKDGQILDIPYRTIIKGDSRVKSIAAASILAKVTRDYLMQYYSNDFYEYGFEQHKGYATRTHRSNIAKHGICEIHRKTFTHL